jgi:hypothetical protein
MSTPRDPAVVNTGENELSLRNSPGFNPTRRKKKQINGESLMTRAAELLCRLLEQEEMMTGEEEPTNDGNLEKIKRLSAEKPENNRAYDLKSGANGYRPERR